MQEPGSWNHRNRTFPQPQPQSQKEKRMKEAQKSKLRTKIPQKPYHVCHQST